MTAILTAIILVITGSSIWSAAQRIQVKQKDVEEALQDQGMVDYAVKLQHQYETLPSSETPWIEESPEKTENEISQDDVMQKLKSRINTMGEGNDWEILARVADEYGLDGIERKLLYAIRIIENGQPGLEMGAGDGRPDHPARRFEGDHEQSLELQAKWAAGTIDKRFNGDLEGFAKRYCFENWRNWLSMVSIILSVA